MTPRVEEVGRVSAFFGRPSAAIVSLTKPLRIGDTVYIKGHTTDLLQRVTSLQLSKRPVEQAEAGQIAGLTVTAICR
jgi:putative protease